MSLKKILTAALALTLLVGSLSGCGAKSGASESENTLSGAQGSSGVQENTGTTPTYDLTAEENTIRFASPSGQIRTAIVILAEELGYYDEEGVNVEFVNASGTEALTAITSNNTDLDVVGTGIVPTLTFIANGSDLVIYEGTASEGGSIIARPDEVEYYKDLQNYAGIRAAMVRGSTSWIITRAKLVELGVDVDSIELVELDSNTSVGQAIVKGEADLGFMPIEYANSLHEIGVETVYEVGELDPNYVCCRQATSRQKLEEKHDAFVRFTIANLRAWEYFEDAANEEEIVKLLAEFSGQTEEYVSDYLFVNRTFMTLDPNESGVITFYQSLGDSGYFDASAVDVADQIDTSIYAEALSAALERYPNDEFYQDKLELYRQYNNALI